MSDREPGPAELRVTNFGDANHAAMVGMVEIIREALTPELAESADQLHAMSLAMAAACMYAGTIFGTLIVAEVARDQDKKRVTDSMAHNFRQGIEVGKRRALRIATEEFGGTA